MGDKTSVFWWASLNIRADMGIFVKITFSRLDFTRRLHGASMLPLLACTASAHASTIANNLGEAPSDAEFERPQYFYRLA